MAHTCDDQDIFCERALSPGLHSHLYFMAAVIIGALFLIGAGFAVFDTIPPSPAWLLAGGSIAFVLMMVCLTRAASR